MMNSLPVAALLLASSAASAQANSLDTEIEYTAYSDGMGQRTAGSAWMNFDLGKSTLVAKGSVGERDIGGESFDGIEGELTLYHDWNDVLSTRTSASLSSDDVVFVKRAIEQDFNLRLLPKTVILAGVKLIKYDNDVDALVISSGGTRYFKRGFVSYRYNHYDLDDRPNTHSHLVSARLNDRAGGGFTQVWIGRGTSLQEFDFAATARRGHSTGVSLRRVQPLTDKVKLNLIMGGTWFDTEFSDYTGIIAKGGLTLKL
jgi:YaiO family outer membrane protein